MTNMYNEYKKSILVEGVEKLVYAIVVSIILAIISAAVIAVARIHEFFNDVLVTLIMFVIIMYLAMIAIAAVISPFAE